MSWQLASRVAKKKLGSDLKLPAIFLALFCFKDSVTCRPDLLRLAKLCEIGKRALFKKLEKLKLLGFLTTEGKGGRGKLTAYTLHVDALPDIFGARNPEPQGTLSGQNGEPQGTQTVNHSSQNGEPQGTRNKEVRGSIEVKPRSKSFVPPTLEQVTTHIKETNSTIDPKRFHAHYEANGWMTGRNRLKDWKAKITEWETNGDFGKPPSDLSERNHQARLAYEREHPESA
jgi:hypothetical protein